MVKDSERLTWEEIARLYGRSIFYSLDRELSTSNNSKDANGNRIKGLTTTIIVDGKTLTFREGLLTAVDD